MKMINHEPRAVERGKFMVKNVSSSIFFPCKRTRDKELYGEIEVVMAHINGQKSDIKNRQQEKE
jgi:hypothetical protein